MAAKRKMEMFPEETFIEEALRDGRARLEDVSMKALGEPDDSLQSRVVTDMDHVHKLDRIFAVNGRLHPVIVFDDPESHVYRLAHGRHRWQVYRNRKLPSIPAYVIDGGYRDAMIYSTMCNQDALLPRTSDDIRKAVYMLLDDDEWFHNSDNLIAEHCGISPGTARKHRVAYCAERERKIPEKLKSASGRYKPSRREAAKLRITTRQRRDGKTQYFANEGFEAVNLGCDSAEAMARFSEMVRAREEKKAIFKTSVLQRFLARRQLWFTSLNLSHQTFPGLFGLRGHGCVVTWEPFGGASHAMTAAFARALFLREHVDPSARAVVVCYPEEAPYELRRLAEKLNERLGPGLAVEFLTPEGLVASIEGGATNGDGEGGGE